MWAAIDADPGIIDSIKGEIEAETARVQQAWLAASPEEQQRWVALFPKGVLRFARCLPAPGDAPTGLFLYGLKRVFADHPELVPMEAAA